MATDERYYTGNTLNKWFAISSILFFISIILTFIDDNDDEFKEYQKEFRALEVETSKRVLKTEIEKVKDERVSYEKKLFDVQREFDLNVELLNKAEKEEEKLSGKFYKANMEFLSQKADIDAIKYKYESEILDQHHNHDDDHHHDHELKYEKIYNEANETLHTLKLEKESREAAMLAKQDEIKLLKSKVKAAQDELNVVLKEVNLAQSKLEKLDRESMTFENQIGDIVRDLPIIDFLDPYYEVKQVVLEDIKYDNNFKYVPVVDRCTSCHLGIDNPEYEDAPQPYTTHPNLDLYITDASPHSFQEFGCTSCHAGRSRGTSFVSAAHTPQSKEQQAEWEEKYDWHYLPLWTEPMIPTKFTEASCFSCHQSQPILNQAEKLATGLNLIDKSGCNNCHLIQTYDNQGKNGPPLTNLEKKVNKEWTAKWINNPQSFRYNTWMPHFFNQENNSSPEMVKRTNAEIFSITEYLFENDDKKRKNNSKKYLGDPVNGEALFNTVGCRGCHVIEEENVALGEVDTRYEMYTSDYGYEPDPDGEGYEKIDRYNLLKYQGPNLNGMGSKTDAEWIYNWIKNPTKYWPDTQMPDLRLTNQESKDITAYLLSFNNEEFEDLESIKYDPIEIEDIAKRWLIKSFPESQAIDMLEKMSEEEKTHYVAKKSISFYGCYTCHNVKGFEDAKPIGAELTHQGSKSSHKLDFGHIHSIGHSNYEWYEQKLANPRIFDRDKIVAPEDKSRMPNFYLKPEEIEAITTAILGFTNRQFGENKFIHNLVEDKTQFEGHKLINSNNCQGCHLIDDFGGQIADLIGAPEYSPPNLNTQGVKTQPDWLFSFFNDPTIIRPNLQVRMPSFNFTDAEWNSIISAFQSMDDHNLDFENDLIVDSKTTHFKAGDKLHEFGACDNCHFYGSKFPKGDPQTWAPNLALTKERLRPEWVIDWLKDPQAIMPGTKMPAPYLPDADILSTSDAVKTWGKDIVKLNGDQELMLEGLRDYIYNIPGKVDITKEIKAYFKKNGYDFMNPEEEEDDDDDWDDDW